MLWLKNQIELVEAILLLKKINKKASYKTCFFIIKLKNDKNVNCVVPKKIKIVRAEKDKQKEYLLRRFEDKDIHRIFMAWNNPQSCRYNSVDCNEASVR